MMLDSAPPAPPDKNDTLVSPYNKQTIRKLAGHSTTGPRRDSAGMRFAVKRLNRDEWLL
jgi:hypothetical protein